jgi:hypothetical protein
MSFGSSLSICERLRMRVPGNLIKCANELPEKNLD